MSSSLESLLLTSLSMSSSEATSSSAMLCRCNSSTSPSTSAFLSLSCVFLISAKENNQQYRLQDCTVSLWK
ncbi:hypothetical protein PR003_g11081 [Phytophthora rubi]|uniref:Uncharacterized protein n=1 Tax=Phytophthora rubi TaxID=129364 RepID=A0A6A3N770_9STRA|nr:hypothetical protein PR001_g8953 [Phytophthora rubi]KAE9047199.1 hypothetical protein PR002_g1175 [Phytophthora rubi]KAE9339305.1 hypothetical protein PR003_g11081 [Phytophthora rubi]